jgi:hypothetical protein
MQAIVLKQAKRKIEGKDSGFRVRGHTVEQEKIERYKKRKNVSECALLSRPSPAAGETLRITS